MNTFVIAECGSAHQGSLDKAKALVDAAKACGATAAKFQYWSSADKLAARRHAPELAEMYEKSRLPAEWLEPLKVACDAAGIEFMCTTYVIEDIAMVAPLVQRFKIASFESGDVTFVRAHVPYGKDLLVSCGLLDDAGLERWVGYRRVATNVALRLLQCTSAYPAPAGELGLAAIRRYALDGFSDHSSPDFTWTGALAVAAGASIVEAHLREEDTPKGNPDYPHSMNPRAFAEYVKHIRFAETCCGEEAKVVQESEQKLLKFRVA